MERKLLLTAPAYDEVDDYGIYECLNANKEHRFKTHGLLNAKQFVFKTNIGDHYCAWTDSEKEIGKGNFTIVVDRLRDDLQCLYIRKEGREEYEITEFEREVIKKTLEEAKKYQDEGNTIDVIIPAEVSYSRDEEQTKDVDEAIESVNEREKQQAASKGI